MDPFIHRLKGIKYLCTKTLVKFLFGRNFKWQKSYKCIIIQALENELWPLCTDNSLIK